MFWGVFYGWERCAGGCLVEGADEIGMGEEFGFPLLTVCKVCGWVGVVRIWQGVESDFSLLAL